MCKQFGYTKQAYYKQLTTVENANVKEETIVGLIKKKRDVWKRGSGRNLYHSLKNDFAEHQLKIGRDKFFDVLRNNKMLIKVKRYKTRTTMSYHHFKKHSNLIESLVPERA